MRPMSAPSRRGGGLRRAALVAAGAALAWFAPAGVAVAATGADQYESAAPLLFSQPGSVPATVGYTTQGGEPLSICGSGAMSKTAWWRITGTGQPMTITTGASTFDTVLAVYKTPTGVPLNGNRIACNDNEGTLVTTSKVTFGSERGATYVVQVGGNNDHGAIDVRASASRPPNDDRANAFDLSGGLPLAGSTNGASQELGETLNCGGSGYAATVWFKWTATEIGDATFRVSAAVGNASVAVYSAAGGGPLGCQVGSLPALALRVAPGDYLVQAGMAGADTSALPTGQITARIDFAVDPDVDGDGALRSADCNDADATVRPGIVDRPEDGVDQDCSGSDAVNFDRDADGEARPADCDDGNAAINHGARDVPGNAVDEDCSGAAAPFPKLESVVRTAWLLKPFRLTQLQVLRAVPSTVELRCSGRGCPFKTSTVKVKKAGAEHSLLTRKLKRARLGSGAKLEVRITLEGHVGFLRRITVGKSGKQPKIADRCLPVGGGKPVTC